KDKERYGGTGKKIPFETSRQISTKIPIMLAGGLTPDNVSEAVKEVSPWAIDVSSGTETDGKKDYKKVASFIAAAKSS
ncbi:MAG: N-(5'-phosphoribosyl)anthranilate isomerase, partial [Dehalococcoidia bacterium]|nr:N-(5'-phosphoribosyl)anthranilate isomerase [Dehalococcoidia bacterium]